MERRNNRISRRGLLTRGLVGLAGAAAVGRLPAKGQEVADRDLPREGSYVDGRKVVYIDGSTKVLDTPDTYYVLVESVERSHGDGFNIVTDRASLDLNRQEIRGATGYGIRGVGDDLRVLRGKVGNFEIGVNLYGRQNLIEEFESIKNWYQGIVIGGENALLSSLISSENGTGIFVTGKSHRIRNSDFLSNYLEDVLVDGASSPNEFLNCKYSTEVVNWGGKLSRMWDYSARVVGIDGMPIERAEVVALNGVSREPEFLSRTNQGGEIVRMPVLSYMNNSGEKDCADRYHVYLISARKEGFNSGVKEFEANSEGNEVFVLEKKD